MKEDKPLTPEAQERTQKHIESLEKQIMDEVTVIKLLLTAGHITQHQVDAARALIFETKD